MSKNKTITNDEFLNMINGILPKNDRSNLMECYPKEEQEKTEEKIEQRKERLHKLFRQQLQIISMVYCRLTI